jgi:hypothetical protein
MRVLVDVVDAFGVEARGATDDAVHLVALPEQELGEVRAVLARDSGDESSFHVVPGRTGGEFRCRNGRGRADGPIAFVAEHRRFRTIA